jgi:hypothetical protein
LVQNIITHYYKIKFKKKESPNIMQDFQKKTKFELKIVRQSFFWEIEEIPNIEFRKFRLFFLFNILNQK